MSTSTRKSSAALTPNGAPGVLSIMYRPYSGWNVGNTSSLVPASSDASQFFSCSKISV